MQSRLFEVDPMAGVAYGMYNSLKKGEGSFEDFLVHYDSSGANEGDNSWLTKMIGSDIYSNLSLPEVVEAMSSLNINTLDFLASSDFFDTQASGYKLLLLQEMSKRGKTLTPLQKQFYQNLDTIIP